MGLKNRFKTNIVEWYRLRKTRLYNNSVEDLEKRLIHLKHWGWTLGFWYLITVVIFFDFAFFDHLYGLTIFQAAMVFLGLFVLTVAIYSNSQEKMMIELFLYQKNEEKVRNRMLELLIENNGGKKDE